MDFLFLLSNVLPAHHAHGPWVCRNARLAEQSQTCPFSCPWFSVLVRVLAAGLLPISALAASPQLTLLLGMLQSFSPSNSSGCIHPSQFTDFGCHPYGRSMHSCRSIWCALLWQLLLLLSTDQVGLECCVKLASSRKPATEKLLQTSSIRSEISRKWGI